MANTVTTALETGQFFETMVADSERNERIATAKKGVLDVAHAANRDGSS